MKEKVKQRELALHYGPSAILDFALIAFVLLVSVVAYFWFLPGKN